MCICVAYDIACNKKNPQTRVNAVQDHPNHYGTSLGLTGTIHPQLRTTHLARKEALRYILHDNLLLRAKVPSHSLRRNSMSHMLTAGNPALVCISRPQVSASMTHVVEPVKLTGVHNWDTLPFFGLAGYTPCHVISHWNAPTCMPLSMQLTVQDSIDSSGYPC
jgi:hypothetical protein